MKPYIPVIVITASICATMGLLSMSTGTASNPAEALRQYHQTNDGTAVHSAVAQTIIEQISIALKPVKDYTDPDTLEPPKSGDNGSGGGESGGGGTTPTPPPISGEGGARIASAAASVWAQLVAKGCYYRYGGNGSNGIDCSHYVYEVMKAAGFPATYQTSSGIAGGGYGSFMVNVGSYTSMSQILAVAQAGDVIAWNGSHAQIYAGNGLMWSWGGNGGNVDYTFPKGRTTPNKASTSRDGKVATLWRAK